MQLDDEIVADFGVGETVVGSGVALTADSIMPLFSSAKPITAVAVGVLVDSGRLNFEDPVATHVSEFAAHGKTNVQIRHLLSHTSGLADDFLADGGSERSEVVARLCDSILIDGWKPGERSAYLPAAGWHMLGEVIERASGSSFESFVRDFVLGPLGMEDTRTNVDSALANDLGDRLGVMHATRRRDPTSMVVDPAYGPERLGQFVRPGSSFHGPAHDLVKLYSMLLRGGISPGGERIVSSDVVEAMTSRQHEGLLDETFGVVIDRGLGFLIDSKRHGPVVPYGYGRAASSSTFGHGGKESSTGFADPERRLAVSLIFNGMPGEPSHDRRTKQVLAAVYEAVGVGSQAEAQ